MQPSSRLRILKIGGRKRAFSLEPVFWEALDEIARTKKHRLGTYVAGLLGDGPLRNASSVLRSGAVGWLLDEYRKLSERDYSGLGQRIVDSIPVPAFVMNQRKEILAFNRAFLQLGTSGSAEKPRSAQLRLNAAFDRVVEMLSEDPQRSLALKAMLDFGDFKREGTVIVTLLERVGAKSFFLCTLRALETPSEAE
jgi:predicted DNA-binding ribbon-helix-helix protein